MNRLLTSRTTALISKHAQYNATNAGTTISNHIYKYCNRMYATATKKPTPKLLILMGPPGAGKGTQARFLTDFSIIGAGDTLREESQHNEEIKQLLARGELASEELIATLLAKKVISILSNEEEPEKIETPEKTDATVEPTTESTPQSILDIQHPGIVKTNNIIIEGYPRNREQGSKLMDMFSDTGFRKQSTLVIHLMCDKDTIKKRLKGRLIDVPSGRTYHVEYRPPKQDQLDDVTQRPLTRRDDDSATEAIQNRLETYKDKTLPTIEMLTENGLTVLDIPSSGSIESVHERIKKEVQAFFKVPAAKEAPKEAPKEAAKEVPKEAPKEEAKEAPKEAEKEAAKPEK